MDKPGDGHQKKTKVRGPPQKGLKIDYRFYLILFFNNPLIMETVMIFNPIRFVQREEK